MAKKKPKRDVNVLPGFGERTFLVSKTGTGKTTKALKLLNIFKGVHQIQIIATKEDEKILALDVPIVTRLEEVPKYTFPEYPMVVYYPHGGELGNPEILDAWCQWIYLRGNTVAYIDELTQVARQTQPLPGFLNLYTRGRSQGCTVIAGTQRPRGVPAIVYTEAENFYKGFLTDKRDRQRVAEFTHPDMLKQVEEYYGVHYFNPKRSDDIISLRGF